MALESNDERSQAIALANRLLDEPNCDPDDDLRTLSRWLIRRDEGAEYQKKRADKACLALMMIREGAADHQRFAAETLTALHDLKEPT